MSFLRSAIQKDLLRILRDPWSVLMWIGIPFFIGAAITLIFGGGGSGPVPSATLLLVDEDQTFVSGLVGAAFNQGPMAEMVEVRAVGLDEGRTLIDEGQASALLVIPAGFSESVLNEEPLELKLWTNPAQRILPGFIEEGLSLMVDGAFYVQRVFGEQIRQLTSMQQQPTNAVVAAMSVGVNDSMTEIAQYVSPLLIDLELTEKEAAEPSHAISIYFFPSIVFMALLFVSQGLAGDLWLERELGTLRRLAGSPQSLTRFLVAKAAATSLVVAGVSGVLCSIGFAYHGISWSKLPIAVIWLTLAGLVLYLILAAVQLYMPTRTSASIIGNFMVFPLMMVGGSFFPFEAMPDWMARIGRWTPNGMMLEQFKRHILDEHDPRTMLLTAFAVTAACGVLFFVCVVRNRKVFAHA